MLRKMMKKMVVMMIGKSERECVCIHKVREAAVSPCRNLKDVTFINQALNDFTHRVIMTAGKTITKMAPSL